jgi:uncharacterized phage-like protein YoqJ
MSIFEIKQRGEYQLKIVEAMTEAEKRQHRCCFTGHRPEKLTGSERTIKAALKKEIKLAIQAGYNVYLTGMARGTDLWAAEIILDLRRKNKDIKLICAIPYEGFEQRWSEHWRQLYQYVRNEADLVRVIGHGYSAGIFQVRNEWMVNHSSRVIAIYNGSLGGTKNTIDYAMKQGISVHIIEQ